MVSHSQSGPPRDEERFKHQSLSQGGVGAAGHPLKSFSLSGILWWWFLVSERKASVFIVFTFNNYCFSYSQICLCYGIRNSCLYHMHPQPPCQISPALTSVSNATCYPSFLPFMNKKTNAFLSPWFQVIKEMKMSWIHVLIHLTLYILYSI